MSIKSYGKLLQHQHQNDFNHCASHYFAEQLETIIFNDLEVKS